MYMQNHVKLIVISLSVFLTQVLLSAQDFRVSDPQKDSVVIRHENGDEEVRYIFQAIEPERIADTTQVGLFIKYYDTWRCYFGTN